MASQKPVITAHYAHGFKSDKLEAQGAVLDKLVKSGAKSGVGND